MAEEQERSEKEETTFFSAEMVSWADVRGVEREKLQQISVALENALECLTHTHPFFYVPYFDVEHSLPVASTIETEEERGEIVKYEDVATILSEAVHLPLDFVLKRTHKLVTTEEWRFAQEQRETTQTVLEKLKGKKRFGTTWDALVAEVPDVHRFVFRQGLNSPFQRNEIRTESYTKLFSAFMAIQRKVSSCTVKVSNTVHRSHNELLNSSKVDRSLQTPDLVFSISGRPIEPIVKRARRKETEQK